MNIAVLTILAFVCGFSAGRHWRAQGPRPTRPRFGGRLAHLAPPDWN